ncbi:response regulator [Acidobacteria bacterium AH-259-A15]|nr:response regulator [Acidobacteria bacterium AH-259-A15]
MARDVLIVDDALFMRSVLKDILKEAGYEIVGEAATGEEALAQFRRFKPTLVTLDMVMPGLPGMDVLKEILKSDPAANVIVISALGQESFVEEALDLGAKGYIVKPFKNEQVVDEINRVLGPAVRLKEQSSA